MRFFCSGCACNSCHGVTVTANVICCLVYSCDGHCDEGIVTRPGCRRESVNSSGLGFANANATAALRSVEVSLILTDWRLSLAVMVCANGFDCDRAQVWVI